MIFCLSTPASAGEGGDSDATEIIVTANRRSENVDKVGTAISVVSGAELAARNVNTVYDLQYLTPSLEVIPQFGSGQPVYEIRGVGLTDYASNNAPSVGLYLDEVAYPITFATNGLMYDVQRVEVLRGPQGTLYGRNTTGGAINYITNKPTTDFTGGLSTQYSSFNSTLSEGYVSGPISNSVQFRVAGEIQGGGAWQTNRETGEKLGDVRRQALRALIDYEPIDEVKIEFNVHASLDHSDANGVYLISPLTALHSAHPTLYPVLPADTSRFVTDWGATPQFATEVGISTTQKPFSHIQTAGGSVRLDWDLGPYTLSDLLSFDNAERNEYDNFGGSSLSTADVFFGTRANVVGNELRLTSDKQGPLTWLGGVYLADQYLNDHYATGYLTLEGFNRSVRYTQSVDTESVFGQATYEIMPKLHVIGGLRVEHETRSLNNFTSLYLDNPALYNPGNTLPHVSTGFTQPSGKVETQYDVFDNDMAYAQVSRGIKSGGFTTYNTNNVVTSTTPFQPEKLLAYEVGDKLAIPQYALRFNVSAFYYDYSDEQIQALAVNPLTGAVGSLVNAPKSHLEGGEAELDWQPIHNLTLTQSAGLAAGKFDDFSAITAAVKENGIYVGVFANRKGVDLPAPKFTANGSISYKLELGQYALTTQGSYSYRSRYNSLLGTTYNVNDYALFNANMTFAPVSGKTDWQIELYGQNIFDKRYDVTRNYFVAGDNIALAGQPATWGLRLVLRD